ncbi:MAG: hypothetical protein HFJ54_05060 [Clostridia bacterium]|nr:hypothetical protein [Clostridia bacterium]
MNGKVYISIRDIAPFVGYEAHNGEYKENIEDRTKMYVESTTKNDKIKSTETTSFFQNSRIISKVAPNSKDDYQNIIITEPVTMVNDKLYVISDGFSIGFNSLFSYDREKNDIVIQTLPFLVNYYSGIIESTYGYSDLSSDFANQKALIYGMIVASKQSTGKYGVLSIDGNEIISPRYNKIEFIENSGEFIITNSSNKVGIAYSSGDTKISVSYDDIKVMDHTLGYYLVKSNSKYGVVDSSESLVVHIEYDKIGIDTSKFPADNLKSQYILYNTLIPVELNKKWGFLDVKGKKITELIYDTVGYVNENTNDKVVNNALTIGDTKVVVVSKDKKYGGVHTSGTEIIDLRYDSIYSITSSGATAYYIYFNGKEYNAREYINAMKKSLGINDKPEVEGDVILDNQNDLSNTVNDTNNVNTNNIVANEVNQNNVIVNDVDANIVNTNVIDTNVTNSPVENTMTNGTNDINAIQTNANVVAPNNQDSNNTVLSNEV